MARFFVCVSQMLKIMLGRIAPYITLTVILVYTYH